jgi:L-amino acid N-acyltransferase YncA
MTGMFVQGKKVREFSAGGKRVVVRYPKMGDVDGLLAYVNSLVEEKARILLTEKQTRLGEARWLKQTIADNMSGKKISLVVECSGRIAGCGEVTKKFPMRHAADHVGEISFGIAKEYRRLGLGEALARTLISLAKKQWKLEIVRSSYVSDNAPSAALHEKLGFVAAGTIPGGIKYGKSRLDEIIVVKKL